MTSTIVRYTNILLHARTMESKEARALLEEHEAESRFIRRARVLNRLLRLRSQITRD